MTPEQLIQSFNDIFGLSEWPTKIEVDVDTYANICQFVFDQDDNDLYWDKVVDGRSAPPTIVKSIILGPNRGIMFKNIELILKR